MRRKIVAANWKENKTVPEALEFARKLTKRYQGTVIICPSFVSLAPLHTLLKGSQVLLASQDISRYEGGAYTGEVSALMVRDFCHYTLVGHSERRGFFHDTDGMVNQKLKLALKAGLKVILCMGETADERQGNLTAEIITRQFTEGLKAISATEMKNIAIAYEPVWAISRGDSKMKAATPEDAERAHSLIRQLAVKAYSQEVAQNLQIIYGGSVKPDNAEALFGQENIDGGLVGNASLDIDSFKKILSYI